MIINAPILGYKMYFWTLSCMIEKSFLKDVLIGMLLLVSPINLFLRPV